MPFIVVFTEGIDLRSYINLLFLGLETRLETMPGFE